MEFATQEEFEDILNKHHNIQYVDAIFISSPTNTHLDLIAKSIKYNKQIFSEKPIDLDLKKINSLKKKCNNYKKTFQIGFNRRFDKSIGELLRKVKNNKVGSIEKIIITHTIFCFSNTKNLV